MFRVSNFDKLLDKATSNLRLEPDWPTIIQICDLIRQNDCTPKYAVAAVKKKLYSQNPHQAMFALLTMESIVKNCGSGIHDEVTSKAFCEMLRDLVKSTQHENLRNKILELIQAWAFAFRNTPKYRSVQDTVNILRAEGFKFPPLKESDAMFSADSAPEWADGEVCHRCRVAFSLMVRRHHCRACGQVFCQQCSSKTSTLPKFGIEKEVRVCDACFDKVSRPPTSSAKLEIVDTSNDYGPTQPQKRPSGGKTAEELQEEEELQLALALSQSEAEHKEKDRRSRPHIAPSAAPQHPTVSPTPSSVSASPERSAAANPELSRYLDRGYWEQRLSRDTASAPPSQTPNSPSVDYNKTTPSKTQDDDAEDKEIDEFVSSLKSQVEIFVNRMKSNSSRGRSIANDTSVQTLFMTITAMHSRLLRYIQQQDDKRVYLESLQDKVTQIRDSRAALDTLRAEHAARIAAQAEAADRQRQMQMAAKLQAMRKKKHEYLQYQRQLALQRVQEQEREMQMRQEQQKHQYMMAAGGGYYMPGVSLHQFQPGYSNQPMYASPQFHPMMPPQASDVTAPGQNQPAMSQPNVPMNASQIGTVSQSMPQLSQAYPMSTPSGVGISQAPINAQQSIPQPNIRQPVNPQIQNQMMMQQMHQMRLSTQPGVHQMMQQNLANGYNAQNIPQQNGQSSQQLPKQNLPNPPQNSTAMMQQMPGQPNLSQQQMNPSNPMLAMQIPNMRMPMMQNNQPSQHPISGYALNQQIPTQIPGQQQSQMHITGQPMSLPSQQILQGQAIPNQAQNISMPSHIPPNQNLPPQVSLAQSQQQLPQQPMPQGPMPHQNQPMPPPGPQMSMQMMPGQPMPSQAQMIPPQGQHLLNQGQPMTNTGQAQPHQIQPNQLPQQIPNQQPGPNQPISQGQQMSQGQQIPQQIAQGQQMQNLQGQQNPQQIGQGQPMKMPQQQQNFANLQPGPQQSQQSQTPVKSEHNNNTAELISFD